MIQARDPQHQVEDSYRAHAGAVLSFLYRLTGDREEAESLCQEVFLRMLRAAPTFPNEVARKTWLYRVARNLVLDHSRKMRPKPTEELEAVDPTPPPDQGSEREDEVERLRRALGSLPELYRHTLTLRFLEELEYAQIAAIEGVTESALRTRVQTGLGLLRKALQLMGAGTQRTASAAGRSGG